MKSESAHPVLVEGRADGGNQAPPLMRKELIRWLAQLATKEPSILRQAQDERFSFRRVTSFSWSCCDSLAVIGDFPELTLELRNYSKPAHLPHLSKNIVRIGESPFEMTIGNSA